MSYCRFGAICVISTLSMPVWAGMASVFDGGWRISAGAVYDSGVKSDMNFMPQQTVTPFSRSLNALTRQQAKDVAWGNKSGTRTTYVNMGKGNATAYVDSKDASSGYGTGHDAGKTTNYRFPAESWGGLTAFEIGYAEYEEVSVSQASAESMQRSANDEAAMPGVTVQLARNLYHDDENNWGVDVAIAFQYAKRNNIMKSSSAWKIGSVSKSTGYYASRYNASGDLGEMLSYSGADAAYIHDMVWNSDANGEYVGSGGNGYAAPIDLDDIQNEWGGGSGSESYAEYGSMDAKGDYENMELMLLAQPYYDVFSWLRINATLGMVVSRQCMEMSFMMFRDSTLEYSSNNDFSQWDVYGVAGLGLALSYDDFTLSGDFLARFLDRDMDVSDRYYRGTISRGDWMFRLMLGYEF